jgi:hypothetical protein
VKTGEVVRLIKAGAGGVLIRRADGGTSRLPGGMSAWVPIESHIDGPYTVMVSRATKPIENKSEATG